MDSELCEAYRERIVNSLLEIKTVRIVDNYYDENLCEKFVANFRKVGHTVNMSSFSILRHIASWNFSCNVIEDDKEILFFRINVPFELIPLSSIFKKIPAGIDQVIKIGLYNINISELDKRVLPIDINLGNYNACLIEENLKYKVALLDIEGIQWNETRLVPVAEYLNFVAFTAGSIEARKQYFFNHDKSFDLNTYIPSTLLKQF